jgi:hypothetical protein
MSEIPEWARPGSQVFVVTGIAGGEIVSIRTIVRATPTQLIDDENDHYLIRTMRRKINDWRSARLYPIDDERCLSVRRANRLGVHVVFVTVAAEKFAKAPDEATAAALEERIAEWRAVSAS